jgi:hypothetical protein
MGSRSEALAQQFEAKTEDAMATLVRLTEADWTKVTEAEKWSVGVTAHHLAGAYEPISGMIVAVVTGQAHGAFTMAMLDQMNAQHARDFADCTKAETTELFRKGAATAAAVVRGLSDEQLDRRGTVLVDAPPMTAEQLIVNGLILHTEEHFGSIRKTVGARP